MASLYDSHLYDEFHKLLNEILKSKDENLINEFLHSEKLFKAFDSNSISKFNKKSLNITLNSFRKDLLFEIAKADSQKLDAFLFKYYYGSKKEIKGKKTEELIKIVIEKLYLFTPEPRYEITYNKVKYDKKKINATIVYKIPEEGEIQMEFFKTKVNNIIVWFPIESKTEAIY